jgi:hypothetical protein
MSEKLPVAGTEVDIEKESFEASKKLTELLRIVADSPAVKVFEQYRETGGPDFSALMESKRQSGTTLGRKTAEGHDKLVKILNDHPDIKLWEALNRIVQDLNTV